ncbi:MAG: TIGR03936 family radical SAM-associated protein [Planctomycetota bacterium]|jgi:radical SAM-linked protein
MVVLIRFSITASLRFLSHAETLRLFSRACIRAGLPLRYSLGFNPHPKISLPCPRSVGLEALDEVLIIQLNPEKLQLPPEKFILQMKNKLVNQLPDGCDLLSVDSIDKTKLQPRQIKYLIKAKKQFIDDSFRSGINVLLESEHLPVRRYIDKKNRQFKDLDLRPFLKSIDLNDKDEDSVDINIMCNITCEGSIRVDEILDLLNLDEKYLAAPVCRTGVEWN